LKSYHHNSDAFVNRPHRSTATKAAQKVLKCCAVQQPASKENHAKSRAGISYRLVRGGEQALERTITCSRGYGAFGNACAQPKSGVLNDGLQEARRPRALIVIWIVRRRSVRRFTEFHHAFRFGGLGLGRAAAHRAGAHGLDLANLHLRCLDPRRDFRMRRVG
jgi:hypothetical protein